MPLACQMAVRSTSLVIFRRDGVSQGRRHGSTIRTHQINLQKIHSSIELGSRDPRQDRLIQRTVQRYKPQLFIQAHWGKNFRGGRNTRFQKTRKFLTISKDGSILTPELTVLEVNQCVASSQLCSEESRVGFPPKCTY